MCVFLRIWYMYGNIRICVYFYLQYIHAHMYGCDIQHCLVVCNDICGMRYFLLSCVVVMLS